MLNNRKRLRILLCAFTTVLVLFCICFNNAIVAAAPGLHRDTATNMVAEDSIESTTVLLDTPITFVEFDYKVFYDINLSLAYITELTSCIQTLDAAICPNEYTAEALDIMNNEKLRLQDIIVAIQADVDRYIKWEQEYYYAAKTYEFLRQHGYSAEVACGIIGNMMIETSGGTLKLKPTVYSKSKSFYGLCQWSRSRRPKNADGTDASFEEQLIYLHEDIPQQFKACGRAFKTSHEKFLATKDPAKAALIFAKVYERCGTGSYGARQRAAKVAYSYFTSET